MSSKKTTVQLDKATITAIAKEVVRLQKIENVKRFKAALQRLNNEKLPPGKLKSLPVSE